MTKFDEAYKRLNPEQKQAVDSIYGPILVVAGPGTGKTQILTLRIANILKQTDTQPESILALTFTDNAARNMQERLVEFIGAEAYKVKITTFHSFANDVILHFPQKFAYKRELTQLDELGKYTIFKKLMDNFDPSETYKEFGVLSEIIGDNSYEKQQILKSFGAPNLLLPDIIQGIETLKREFITLEKIVSSIKNEIYELSEMERINPKTKKEFGKWTTKFKLISKNIELYDFYKKYKQITLEEGVYDFGDMISLVVEKFRSDDEILAFYQERYLHVLVDEYQDTNGAQNEIVKAIGSWDDTPNVFVVGDDDQSIFRFQGANLSNIIDFTLTYPQAKTIVLSTNYRSTQNILDVSDKLISNNQERLVNEIEGLTKKLNAFSDSKNEQSTYIASFEKEELEYYFIATKIEELVQKGVKLNEIAVIYTRHINGEKINQLLNNKSISTKIIKGENLFEQDLFVNILAILDLIEHPENNVLFGKVLMLKYFNFDAIDTYKIFRYLQTHKNVLIMDVLIDIELLNEIGLENPMLFTSFADRVLRWKKVNENFNLRYLVDLILNESKILEKIQTEKDYVSLNVLKNLVDFIESRTKENFNYKINNILLDVNILIENNISTKLNDFLVESDGVNLLTAHASKGLEFEYVFIPKMINGTWGNVRNSNKLVLLNYLNIEETEDNDDKIEEERRLFFVAVTRAKKELFLTYSEEYLDGELKYKKSLPSQFIEEIDSSQIERLKFPPRKDQTENLLNLLIKLPEEIDLTYKQKVYLSEKIKSFKLSASSLNTYLDSPKDFLYRHLLKVPEMTTKHLALGTAVHAALEMYFGKLIEGEKVNIEYLNSVFENTITKEFEFHPDYKETVEIGREMLRKWYEYSKDNEVVPVALEYGFYGHNVYYEDIPLTGKIDKIEWINKSLKKVKLIDYKTGSPKTRGVIHKPLDGGVESNIYRQLVFYKLMTELDSYFPYEVEETEIQYIKADKNKFRTESFVIPREDIDTLKVIIKEVMSKIRNLEF